MHVPVAAQLQVQLARMRTGEFQWVVLSQKAQLEKLYATVDHKGLVPFVFA